MFQSYENCKLQIINYQNHINKISKEIAIMQDELKKVETKESENKKAYEKAQAEVERLASSASSETMLTLYKLQQSLAESGTSLLVTGADLSKAIRSRKEDLDQLEQQLELEQIKLNNIQHQLSPTPKVVSQFDDCLVTPAIYTAAALASGDIKSFQNVVFGGTCPWTYFRPPIVQEILARPTHQGIVDAAKATINRGYLVSITISGFSERSNPLSVMSVLDPALNEFFATSGKGHPLYLVQGTSMASLGAGLGYTTGDWQPDMMVCCDLTKPSKIPLCVIERKPTYTGTIGAGGQAIAEACNVALLHRWMGVPVNKVAVPFILTNGSQYQFGFVTLLDEIYPAAHLVTVSLECFSNEEQIATLLAQIKDFCYIQADLLANASPDLERPTSSVVVRLNRSKFYKKPWYMVYPRGELIPEKAMVHLHSVFEKLKDLEDVVKPIGFTSMSAPSQGEYLVFPRVDTSTYKLGIPTDQDVFTKYLNALKNLLKNVHAAGVVHMDLYPSNIFWCQSDGEVQIKLIDWDAATFIGQAIPETMKETRKADRWKSFCSDTADARCDAWFLYICSLFTQDERRGMNGIVVEDVNIAYSDALDKRRQKPFGDLLASFDEWFATVWSS